MEAQTFSAVLRKEDGVFIAECPEIGTVSQGETIEKAVDNLKEATELYLEEFPITEKTKPMITIFEVGHAKIEKNIRA